MMVFVDGGKPEKPAKNPRSRDENQQQPQPKYGVNSGIQIRATSGASSPPPVLVTGSILLTAGGEGSVKVKPANNR